MLCNNMNRELVIGDFAATTGLSASALRFYDERGLLRPARVDRSNGYRYYSPQQVETAQLIRDLRRLGLTLTEIETYLESPQLRTKLIERRLEALRRQLDEALGLASALRETAFIEKEESMAVTVDGSDFARTIDAVSAMASKDDGDGPLRNVLIEASEGSLRLVATDRYRLVVHELSTQGAREGTRSVLVEPASLLSASQEVSNDPAVVVDITPDSIKFSAGERNLVLEAVDGTFPSYRDLLEPKRTGHVLEVNGSAVADALENVTADEGVVKISVRAGAIVVQAADELHEVRANYDGPGIEFFVNRQFALDAILSSVGAEVIIEATWPNAPVVFRSADEGSYICMIMPAQFSEAV